ncbi:MAG: hypothetical protein ACK4RK_05730 [Gemmataceae bacterium]
MTHHQRHWRQAFCVCLVMGLPLLLATCFLVARSGADKLRGQEGRPTSAPPVPYHPFPMPDDMRHVNLMKQTAPEALAKSVGCIHCHKDVCDPHGKETLHLGCVDCHGGDPTTIHKEQAHVMPRYPSAWRTSANPVRSYTLLNHESPEFIRFVNPGDLRIAHISCGTAACHPKEVLQVRKSMMTHGCMLWGAAAYNNGSIPIKRCAFGESYSMCGVPQRMQTVPQPSEEEQQKHGVVPTLDPLPRFEISQPANVYRIFERGGRFRPETGIPERMEEPGRPRTRLSLRGLGTENRTDPGFVTLQKTRLLNPTLNFLGTNDHAGDYRSSGCTACHMIYANDRSPVHSGPYAKYGNRGYSFSPDPMIPKDESGHPIHHEFTKGIPTSQCIVCHIHPGTNVMNSYIGYMWWDEETDGQLMYPKKQKYPTAEEFTFSQMSNPDEAAAQGNWSNLEFLANLIDLNPFTKHTYFGDFHGHGWVFRAVFRKDRQGNLLNHKGEILPHVTAEQRIAAVALPAELKEQYRCCEGDPTKPLNPHLAATTQRDGLPLHMLDVHMEKGMHCVDCHFVQDVHGNTRLQMEVRAAIEIQCIDCHGTITQQATLRTTGPASYTSGKDGRNLETLRTPFGQPRFERRDGKIYQRSMVEKDLVWEIKQTQDTISPGHPNYNPKAHLAKTVRFDEQGQMVWGDLPKDERACAHANANMTCIACHSSWNPSCFGCHLPQKADKKLPLLTFEGDVTLNYVSYNFQTLRDDVYMLARDGDVTGNRICPSRSSCAIHVGSYNNNRESIYVQQQTIAAEGQSGIAFSTNVPHTVRGRDGTKMCTDCHVSVKNDNNALMAQLLMLGTKYTNFIGRYCWVAAGDHGLFGVVVTERQEPQAVIGSSLQALAFPDYYRKHVENGYKLKIAHEHPGKDIGDQIFHPLRKVEIHNVQLRGEYLFAACGKGGLRVFDVAFIDNKAFSERITTAPVSPLGQRFFVHTKNAKYVALPTTMTPDPTRTRRPENKETPLHPIYAYVFVADECEGLIVVNATTALDGIPTNNFLHRTVTFNPDGLLNGAHYISIIGTYAYICCDAGLVVVSLADPKNPVIVHIVEQKVLKHPKALAAQFRYAFVCVEDGIAVLDITHLHHPIKVGELKLKEAHRIYVARNYAYVAAGKQGLVILNVEEPEHPKIDQVYNANGLINDLHDVKLGITYVSEFAYLADGKNGLRVVQLTSPETPGNEGFSVRPTPCLIATYKLPEGGHALAISEGLDRDRAVDECGNQISVFGRVGARPFNFQEQRQLYLRNGEVWRVSDDPFNPLYHYIGPLPPAPAKLPQPQTPLPPPPRKTGQRRRFVG